MHHYLTSCIKDPRRNREPSSNVLWSEPLDSEQATSSTSVIRQLLTQQFILPQWNTGPGFCSDLESQLMLLSFPVPPGSEADGTKEQTSPVQHKHCHSARFCFCAVSDILVIWAELMLNHVCVNLTCFSCRPWPQVLSSRSHRPWMSVFSCKPVMLASLWPSSALSFPIRSINILLV